MTTGLNRAVCYVCGYVAVAQSMASAMASLRDHAWYLRHEAAR